MSLRSVPCAPSFTFKNKETETDLICIPQSCSCWDSVSKYCISKLWSRPSLATSWFDLHSCWAYYPTPWSSLVLTLQGWADSFRDLRRLASPLPHLPGRTLVPQFPDIAIASPRQVCWVHRDEVIGSFTLLSLPAHQEEPISILIQF